MNRLVRLLLLLIALLPLGNVYAEAFRIGVLLWHNSKHSQDIVKGFSEGMEISGLEHQLDIQVADGDPDEASKILKRWSTQNVDLVFSAGKRATEAAIRQSINIPQVFVAAADPEQGPIHAQLKQADRNLTGVMHWVSADNKLAMFHSALPTLEHLGVLYNPDNPLSSNEVKALQKAVGRHHVTLHAVKAGSRSALKTALEELRKKPLDAIWLPYERLVIRNIDLLRSFSREQSLPVFSSTLHAVEFLEDSPPFALAGFAVKFYELGRRSVQPAINILTAGVSPHQLPVKIIPPKKVANINAARAIGYTFPPLFLASCERVIRGFSDQKIVIGGTGDSQHLIEKLASSLEKKLNGGRIIVPESIGSSGGIKALLADRINLARTARPLHHHEKIQGLNSQTFAISPVVFVVHPSVSGITNLSSQQIIDIYSGKLRNWNELGGDNQRIYPVMREPGDSSLGRILDYIPALNDIEKFHAKIIYKTPAAVAALRNHRFTVGFLPLSAIKNIPLKILKIDGVYPSSENVRNGSYPLTVPYSIVNRNQPGAFEQAFINYLYSDEGQQIISDFGAIPVSH